MVDKIVTNPTPSPGKPKAKKKDDSLEAKIRKWEKAEAAARKKRAKPTWKKLLVRPLLFLALLFLVKTVKKGWGWWEGDPFWGGGGSDTSNEKYKEIECCASISKDWKITAEPLQSTDGCAMSLCQVSCAPHVCKSGEFHKASRDMLRALRECKGEQSLWDANMTDFSSCAGELLETCGKTGSKWEGCLRDNVVQRKGSSSSVTSCRPASLATTGILCHGKARVRKFAHSALDPILFQGLSNGPQAFVDMDDNSMPTVTANILTNHNVFSASQLSTAYSSKCPKNVVFEYDEPNPQFWKNLGNWVKCNGIVVVDDLVKQLSSDRLSLTNYVLHENVKKFFEVKVAKVMESGKVQWEVFDERTVDEIVDWPHAQDVVGGYKMAFHALKSCEVENEEL